MDEPTVELGEEAPGAADGGVQRHVLAGREAVQRDVQVVHSGTGHRDLSADEHQERVLQALTDRHVVCPAVLRCLMARGVRPASEYATSVVRLFPDYAGTVIWFIGPIAYGETRLDAGLVADLQAWEASYYAGLTSDYSWRSPDVEAHFNKLGAGLARRLADQIGDQFQVQYAFDEAHRRVSGRRASAQPKGCCCFPAAGRSGTRGMDAATRRR